MLAYLAAGRRACIAEADANVQSVCSGDVASLKCRCNCIRESLTAPQAIVDHCFCSFGTGGERQEHIHVALAHDDPAIVLDSKDLVSANLCHSYKRDLERLQIYRVCTAVQSLDDDGQRNVLIACQDGRLG